MTVISEIPKILVVDDDEQIADILSLRLEAEGYAVDTCGTVVRALDLLSRNNYSLVLLDVRLRDGNGVESLPRFRDVDGDVPIFIITAHGDVDSAVQAFSSGANGYIRKPFQDGDLKLQISQAVEAYKMKLEVQRLRRLVGNDQEIDKIILARDPVMRRFLEQVRTASMSISNVVIYGESGTGKELVARALHQLGARSKGPFVAINCGAFPENLLESELFGYVKGAFTDARENKVGHIVRAGGGTLFLDEIGDAPLSIQVRLLRVLQEREVLPLGGHAPIKVDVRVIAATHRDLRQLVTEGRFREDLFYRLQVLPLHTPALRFRRGDIGYLANAFAMRFAAEHGRKVEGFTTGAMKAMLGHSWPGNVRELQNRVEHGLVMGKGALITAADLFPETANQPVLDDMARAGATVDLSSDDDAWGLGDGAVKPYKEAKERFEKQYISALLRHAKGNIAAAARIAGKYRTEVYGLIKKYQLDPRDFKQN
jgi:two-component system response regulator GlrR